MKVLKKLKTFFVGLLVLAFFIFATAMALVLIYRNKYGVTQFGDTSLVLINTQNSSEKFKKGSLVLTESKKLQDYKIGKEMFVYVVEGKIVHIEFGKLGVVDSDNKRIVFENGRIFKDEFIIGQPTKSYEFMGTFLSVVGSTMGFLFVILIPCFLIFIYQIYALVVEIRYGKENYA